MNLFTHYLLKTLIFIFLIYPTADLFSAVFWTGALSTDWNVGGNWDSGMIPTPSDDVIILGTQVNPVIKNGTNAFAKSVLVEGFVELLIESGGTLNIDDSNGHGLINSTNALITNQGTINIGAIHGVSFSGISNGSEFINEGIINIQGISQMQYNGITVVGPFINASTGVINVIQSNGNGILITVGEGVGGPIFGHFENAGLVNIGQGGSIGKDGINCSFATLDNLAGACINIDNTTLAGFENSFGTSTNAGIIKIGANGAIGTSALQNNFSFTNSICGQIILFDDFNNMNFGPPFLNEGLLSVNASDASVEGTLTNDGVIEDVQNTFPIGGVTNNDVIIKPIAGLFCQEIGPALLIGGANSFTIETSWYKEMSLSTVGGIYNNGTNGFTQTTFGTGNHTAYFKVTDNINLCDFTVSIALDLQTDTEVPTVNCKAASLNLDQNGNATLTVDDIFDSGSDNCASEATLKSNASLNFTNFDCDNIGTNNPVTLTTNDGNGNSNSCNTTVTIQDVSKPNFTDCPSYPLPFGTDLGECFATISFTSPSATDNCEVAELKAKIQDAHTNATIVNWTTNPEGQFPPGDYKIKWRAKDPSGNKRVCTETFSVIDAENPVANCVPSLTVQLVNGQVSITTAEIDNGSTDNCGIQNLSYALNQNTFGCANRGFGTVTLTVEDAAGNKDDCSSNLIVLGTTLSIYDVTNYEGTHTYPYTFYFFKMDRTDNSCFLQFDYNTEDGTATLSDNDYIQLSGTHYFVAGGSNIRYMIARVLKDSKYEPDEVFYMKLSNATAGVTILDDTGDGEVLNDDAAPLKGSDSAPVFMADAVSNAVKTTGLNVFPSPATSDLFISAPAEWFEKGALKTAIYDGLGRKIIGFPLEESSISIDISALLPGSYQVVTYLKNGEVEVKRFLKVDGLDVKP